MYRDRCAKILPMFRITMGMGNINNVNDTCTQVLCIFHYFCDPKIILKINVKMYTYVYTDILEINWMPIDATWRDALCTGESDLRYVY